MLHVYQLTKNGRIYGAYHNLEDILKDVLSLNVNIIDIWLLSKWINEKRYKDKALIKLRREMTRKNLSKLFWLNDKGLYKYYIIPAMWTLEETVNCLNTFDNDSTYKLDEFYLYTSEEEYLWN